MRALVACLLFLPVTFALGEEKQEVSLAELNSGVAVVGELGHPIFTVHRVKGIVVKGDQRSKADAEKVYLKISEVDGKSVSAEIAFEAFDGRVGIPKEPVSKILDCMAYEVVYSDGVPQAAFDHLMPVASTLPKLRSRLVILKLLE